MATYAELTGSLPTSTTSYFVNRIVPALYANDLQVNLLQDLPWITTICPEKSEAYYADTVIIESLEDIEMANCYV